MGFRVATNVKIAPGHGEETNAETKGTSSDDNNTPNTSAQMRLLSSLCVSMNFVELA